MPTVVHSSAQRSTSSKPRATPVQTEPQPAWKSAIAALGSYDSGSDRAVLLPLDEAVRAALRDETLRRDIEAGLLEALAGGLSHVAGEYVCGKLAIIGSERCVPALATLLRDPVLNAPARTALEAIPGRAAGRALREALPRLQGMCRLGVLQSLATRRDAPSVPLLAALARDSDTTTASAALAALGEIGSTRAAQVLREAAARVPPENAPALCDALLVCARRLASEGNKTEARRLLQTVLDSAPPPHIQVAARRLLNGQNEVR